MIKRIVTYCLIAFAVLLFCGYFAAASYLSAQGRKGELCTGISVTILDSAANRFVSPEEIRSIILSSDINPVGRPRTETQLDLIEELLESRSAIRLSDASVSMDGILRVKVTQRRPVLRVQTEKGAFYIDDTGYIFPWVNTFTSYVPVVSGHIPVRLEEGYRGVPEGDDRQPGAGGADRRGRLCPGSRPFGGLYHQDRRLPGGCGSRLRGRHGLMVCPS